MRNKILLSVLLGMLALVTACRAPAPTRIDSESRAIIANATPGYAWVGYATIHNDAMTPIPRPTYDPLYPGNYPIGMECQERMDLVWSSGPDGADTCTTEPCSTSNIDWSEFDTCINEAAAYTVTLASGVTVAQPVLLTIPPRWTEAGGSGTSGAPYNVENFAAWQTVLGWNQPFERVSGVWYTGVNYDDVSFLNRMKQFVTEAGARYNDDANVIGVRVNVGFLNETQPVNCASADCDNNDSSGLFAAHEASVASCAAYRNFVITLANAAYDAFPDKAVYVPAGPPMCSDSAYDRNYEIREYLWEDATTGWTAAATQRAMGYSYNAIDPDRADADGYSTDLTTDYKTYRFGLTANAYPTPLPVIWEYSWTNNASAVFGDSFAHNVWTAYAGAALGGEGLLPMTSWKNNFSDEFWNVVDHWLGGNIARVWAVFREREWPTYRVNTVPIYASGFQGDYTNGLTVLTPDAYPQYCSQSVINAAATAVFDPAIATPIAKPCGITNGTATPYKLPTPAATVQATPSPDATSQFNVLQRVANRQARKLRSGETLALALDTTRADYGTYHAVSGVLTYLDIGTDDLAIQVATGPSTSASIAVNRQNTGLWQREVFSATAYLSNALTVSGIGAAFVAVTGGSSTDVYLHEVYADISPASPTPTYTPTITPSPTSTPNLLALVCQTLAVTVDGSLAEWSAVTPVALDASAARYVAPPSPTPTASPTPGGNTPTPQPISADISGSFACAWSGSNLYVSGVITDDSVNVPVGAYRNGDSALVALDGRGDGYNRLRQDDHDLYIPAPGAGITGTVRVLDYGNIPIAVTTVYSDTASGWQFEMLIPAGVHNAGTLSASKFVIYTFGLYDNDGGVTFEHEIIGYRRRADLD